MIPYRSVQTSAGDGLAALVIEEIEAIEHGLAVVLADLPLAPGVEVDALAHDRDGKPVLVLVAADDDAGALFERAAIAVTEYARARSLLERVLRGTPLDFRAEPALLLIARRFSDATLALMDLLRVRAIECVEVALVESGGSTGLLVTARGRIGAVARQSPPETAGAEHRDGGGPNGPREREGGAIGSAPLAGGRRSSQVEGGVGGAPAPGANGSNGLGEAPAGSPCERPARALREEIKQRILRMSPDVYEESDGDALRFHVGPHHLATLRRQGGHVVVSTPDHADCPVTDEISMRGAIDLVFERFFQLVEARRKGTRPAGGDQRPRAVERGGKRSGGRR